MEIEYTLTEEAVDGYTGKVEGNLVSGYTITNTKNSTVVLPDEPKTANITLSKRDDSGNELKGATIIVTRKDDNSIIKEWESNGETVTFDVDCNSTYILTETATPKGYFGIEPIEFFVDSSGYVSSSNVEIKSDNLIVIVNRSIEKPKTEEPTGLEPKKEEPKAEEPKSEEIKPIEEPKAEEPKVEEIPTTPTENGNRDTNTINTDYYTELPKATYDSPETIKVISDEGVPLTYKKVKSSGSIEEYTYVPDTITPLAKSAKTGDNYSPIWKALSITSLVCLAFTLRKKEEKF